MKNQIEEQLIKDFEKENIDHFTNGHQPNCFSFLVMLCCGESFYKNNDITKDLDELKDYIATEKIQAFQRIQFIEDCKIKYGEHLLKILKHDPIIEALKYSKGKKTLLMRFNNQGCAFYVNKKKKYNHYPLSSFNIRSKIGNKDIFLDHLNENPRWNRDIHIKIYNKLFGKEFEIYQSYKDSINFDIYVQLRVAEE